MEEYYFLFFVALLWIIFATVQDLKTREVSNWLSFSLIAIALAYRAFYSAFINDWEFFAFGLLGFGIFFVLAHAFYYARVFAGGDAKLLMGLGAVLPFSSYYDLAFVSLLFISALFSIGAVYSLIYSVFLVYRNTNGFKKEFVKLFINNKKLCIIFWVFSGLLIMFSWQPNFIWVIITLFFLIAPLLYIYLKALETSCMIKLISADKLTEGDWLEHDIRVGGHIIKKSVHGLSLQEIKMLRKAGKKALIKEGIPFVPAFLIAFLVMVLFFSVLGLDFQKLVSLLEGFFV